MISSMGFARMISVTNELKDDDVAYSDWSEIVINGETIKNSKTRSVNVINRDVLWHFNEMGALGEAGFFGAGGFQKKQGIKSGGFKMPKDTVEIRVRQRKSEDDDSIDGKKAGIAFDFVTIEGAGQTQKAAVKNAAKTAKKEGKAVKEAKQKARQEHKAKRKKARQDRNR